MSTFTRWRITLAPENAGARVAPDPSLRSGRQTKSVAQRIIVVEPESRLAREVCDAANFHDHGLARAGWRRVAHRRSGEDCPCATLEPALLADPRLAPRHLQRHSRRDAAACRAAIDLTTGEDADVAAR